MRKIFYILFLFTWVIILNNAYSIVIKNIYIDNNQNGIYYDTPLQKQIPLIEDSNYVFQIVDQTSDLNWILIQQLDSKGNAGRTESTLFLYHVPSKKKISNKLLGTNVFCFVGFEEINNKTFIVYADNNSKNLKRILCSKILKRL